MQQASNTYKDMQRGTTLIIRRRERSPESQFFIERFFIEIFDILCNRRDNEKTSSNVLLRLLDFPSIYSYGLLSEDDIYIPIGYDGETSTFINVEYNVDSCIWFIIFCVENDGEECIKLEIPLELFTNYFNDEGQIIYDGISNLGLLTRTDQISTLKREHKLLAEKERIRINTANEEIMAAYSMAIQEGNLELRIHNDNIEYENIGYDAYETNILKISFGYDNSDIYIEMGDKWFPILYNDAPEFVQILFDNRLNDYNNYLTNLTEKIADRFLNLTDENSLHFIEKNDDGYISFCSQEEDNYIYLIFELNSESSSNPILTVNIGKGFHDISYNDAPDCLKKFHTQHTNNFY